MNDCLFCKIVTGTVPAQKLYEDEKILAFLDIFPVSQGHALIIPKNHAQDLNSGSKDDAVAIMETAYFLAPIIMKALGASGYNLGMNHGVSAGQDIFHTHLHLMPRYDGEARNFDKTNATPEELKEIGEKIRKEFNNQA